MVRLIPILAFLAFTALSVPAMADGDEAGAAPKVPTWTLMNESNRLNYVLGFARGRMVGCQDAGLPEYLDTCAYPMVGLSPKGLDHYVREVDRAMRWAYSQGDKYWRIPAHMVLRAAVRTFFEPPEQQEDAFLAILDEMAALPDEDLADGLEDSGSGQ